MNDKKSMRIFWISLCLLVVSAALIIVAVQYRGRRVPLEGGQKSDQINPAGEPRIQTDSNTGAADVSDNAGLAKTTGQRIPVRPSVRRRARRSRTSLNCGKKTGIWTFTIIIHNSSIFIQASRAKRFPPYKGRL